ncbi:MAG: hypothetical protein EXS00_00330 [Phycisphaerales bacterium]|nr:hypothetical protein [Phycisphaerales bacterium]
MIESQLHPELVLRLSGDFSRDALLLRLTDALILRKPELDRQSVFNALLEREAAGQTATPEGVAFPHAIRSDILESVMVIATTTMPVPFSTDPATPPARLFMALFGSPEQPWRHVQTLARLARIASEPQARARLLQCADSTALYEQMMKEIGDHA